MDNNEPYMGGFRCAMCDWNDEVTSDYSIEGWFVTILHSIVHAIQAKIKLS